jgi:hypothetical protein
MILHILIAPLLLAISKTHAAPLDTRIVTLNDNAGWCWFQDERAIVIDDKLFVASVANSLGTDGAHRGGNIQITSVDLTNGEPLATTVLHAGLENDDHDAPALLALPDKRILALYARHGRDELIRHKTSLHPADITAWQPERQITRDARVTYSNLFLLPSEGRIYNFYRGENWNPNWIISDDLGKNWHYGGRLIAFDGRPYVKYASNNRDTIHFIATEHHPHSFPNSIYHACLKAGKLHKSDGTVICNLDEAPIKPEQATKVFPGDKDNVAWACDIHLDNRDRPYIAYTVQKQMDRDRIHYRYARWDGRTWNDHFLAHAGTALYEREAHYAGLLALHPADPDRVYIATDADPATGQPLISRQDNQRHYEIFAGHTRDSGATWNWEPITHDSNVDNIRPIIPIDKGKRTILLWLRGMLTSYTKYDLDLVGIIRAADDNK